MKKINIVYTYTIYIYILSTYSYAMFKTKKTITEYQMIDTLACNASKRTFRYQIPTLYYYYYIRYKYNIHILYTYHIPYNKCQANSMKQKCVLINYR